MRERERERGREREREKEREKELMKSVNRHLGFKIITELKATND